MNRSIVPPLAFLLSLSALPALPGVASAQERIELEATPDLSVYEAVLPLGRRWKRQRSGEGTSAAWSLGVGVGKSGDKSGGVAAGTLALGWRSPDFLLGLRSELTGFIPAEGEALDLAKTRGRHRAVAVAHLGSRRDDYGVHVGLDAYARHSGGQPFRLDAPRYGAAPLKTLGGDLGVTLRLGDDEFSPAVPIHFKSEETRWDSGALAAARTQQMTMGFGMQPGPRDGVRGSMPLLRASIEHTRFDRRAAFGSNPSNDGDIAGASRIADEFRKVTVGTGIDKVTFFDRKALGTFAFHLGWSWIEADQGDETVRVNALDFKLGTNVKFGKPGDSSRIGFALSRDPNRSADGSRVISDWRVELSSDYEHGKLDLGVRGGLSWLSSKAGGDGSATPTLIRYGTNLEAFYKIPLNFQVGGYVGSSFEPQNTFDPWAVDRSWNTEAGLLLRWKRPAVQDRKSSYRTCGYRPDPPPEPRPLRRPIELHRAN